MVSHGGIEMNTERPDWIDELAAAIDEAIRQRSLLKRHRIKSTSDWWAYQRAMENLRALTAERQPVAA